jgi:hypothetical protein
LLFRFSNELLKPFVLTNRQANTNDLSAGLQ